MCDPRDLGLAVTENAEGSVANWEPNLYIYDSYPGGIGQSAPLFRMAPDLIARTVALLAQCTCEAGCPSCVGPVGEVGERGKEIASALALAVS